MPSEPINLLLIEDNPADAKLIEIMLRDVESQLYNISKSLTFKEGIELAQQNKYDLVLLDLSLPDSFGLDTIKNAAQQLPEVPIIILTGRDDEEFALEVVRAGAQDYLVKGQINSGLLSRTIRYSIKRKELEAELKASEARLNIIVENNISGIVVLNKSNIVRFVNPAAEKMLGKKEAQLLGTAFFLPFSQQEPIQANINNTGLLVEVLATETLWDDEQSFLLTLHDITELKRAEERLRIRNLELTRMNKALDRFVYIISHDLKKPIANIIGLLSLGEKDLLHTATEKGKTIFQKMIFSSQQLKKMVEDLLETTKKEALSGKNTDLIELRKVYDETAASMEQLIVGSDAKIKTDFADYPFIAYPYQDMMSIFSNLLSNAIKYTDSTKKPQVLIKSEKTEQGPVLFVKDNGIGIDLEKEKDKLFQKYQRFNTTVEGTGLGLWIVKEIVEKNGGNISVDSKPGQGTTFKIAF